MPFPCAACTRNGPLSSGDATIPVIEGFELVAADHGWQLDRFAIHPAQCVLSGEALASRWIMCICSCTIDLAKGSAPGSCLQLQLRSRHGGSLCFTAVSVRLQWRARHGCSLSTMPRKRRGQPAQLEVIVVDGGSTDDSVAIAKGVGANV